MAKFRPISEAALKKAKAKAAENPTPRATTISFNRTVDMINIELNTGATVSFPPEKIEGIKGARRADLLDVRSEGGGTAIWFPSLDVYLSVAPLLEQFFGPMEWGRKERRAAASRANGKRGGRPPSKATHTERALAC
jgi:hypothetical protein